MGAVSGPVDLSGPDDFDLGLTGEEQRLLLRGIYAAAGGVHPSLSEYDAAMLNEGRCAVLIEPHRIWSNPAGSEHQEPKDHS